MGQMLPMLPPRPTLPGPLPIDPAWTCKLSGDCCSKPAEVVMRDEERLAILPKVPVGVQTHWREVEEGLWALKAAPCPFFIFNTCVVYEVRPYNCRRFACMRPDPKTEPFDMRGDLGCLNLEQRIRQSRVVRRLAQLIQRRAQRWALAHGWKS